MQVYKVLNMTCDHCRSAIEKAVMDVDPNARVSVDLAAHKVSVRTGAATTRIADAIRSAGYDNEPIAS